MSDTTLQGTIKSMLVQNRLFDSEADGVLTVLSMTVGSELGTRSISCVLRRKKSNQGPPV
jgi:hypothetical protein